MLLIKKGTQYEVVRKLGRQDVLDQEEVATTAGYGGSPLADPMRFVGADIVELYSHRWDIELGYREMKYSLQQHRLTLQAAEIRQELWACCWRTTCYAAG